MHVSASASSCPGTWGSGQGGSAADQGGGGEREGRGEGWHRKPDLFLEGAWEGAKKCKNKILIWGWLCGWVPETRGQMSHRPCRESEQPLPHTLTESCLWWRPLASDLSGACRQSSLDWSGACGRHQRPLLWYEGVMPGCCWGSIYRINITAL